MGHHVGLICDARPADKAAESTLRNLNENICDLGVVRAAMSRHIGLSDLTACRSTRLFARDVQAQILHGHGAKGGAYARLAAHKLKRGDQDICAFYTPHGGSLHYSPGSLQGYIFMELERRLGRKTDGLIFESAYSANLYQTKVGAYPCEARVIPNGLKPQDFHEPALDENAADFVFVGELRHLKGVDVLLHSLAELRKKQSVTAYIAGGGPDAAEFKALARKLNLTDAVSFPGPIPAGAAFTRGRCLIVPSRAESFPYIVLEAGAARMPMIATQVGGIPEIVEGCNIPLLPGGDTQALTQEMQAFLDKPEKFVERATVLRNSVAKRFSVDGMAQAITDFYRSSMTGISDI